MGERHLVESRRGFTLVIVPLVLAITLVILGVIYAMQHQTPITPNGPRPLSIKVVAGTTVIAGWFIVMASAWAEKKGHKSANIFFGAILLLFNLAMLNAVTGWSASMRAKNAGRTATPMAPPPIASAPMPPPSSNPAQGPTNSPAGNSGANRGDAIALPPLPPPYPVAEKPAIDLEPLAVTLTKEIAADIALRAADAEAIYKILEKPRHDRTQLDDQIEALGKAKRSLEETSARVRGVSEEFRTRAEALGAEMTDSMARSIELGNEVQSFERFVACDSVARAADTGKELLVLLRDNITKWTFNGKGEITTKEKKFEYQLFGPKAQVEFALRDKSKNLEALKGK